MTCSGRSISNLACTSGIPQISMPLPIRAGRYIKIFSETNWAKSLSGVTIKVLKPSFSACLARVPMMSSASKPAISTTGIFILRSISWIKGTAILMASGVSSRLALYSPKSSVRETDPPLSKQTAKWSGRSFLITSKREFMNPKMAEVSIPLELIRGFFIKA